MRVNSRVGIGPANSSCSASAVTHTASPNCRSNSASSASMRTPRATGCTPSPAFSTSPQRNSSANVSSTVDSKLFPGG